MTDSAIVPASPAALVPSSPARASEHPAAVYLASLGERSRRVQLHALGVAADIMSAGRADVWAFPWATLRYQHMAALRAALAARYAPATANRTLAAVRRVIREAERLGLLDADTSARARDVQDVKGDRLPAGRNVPDGERSALFGVCDADRSPAGLRDSALIAVAYAAGLRRDELVGLDLADYDANTGALTIREGKGRKDRLTYVESGAAARLAAWLALRGSEPGPMFYPLTKAGAIVRRRMTAAAFYAVLARRAEEAHIDRLSPHSLRRTWVGDLLDAGADLATVQRLAGHNDPSTTSRYDRRPAAAQRAAVNRLHVPYPRRPR